MITGKVATYQFGRKMLRK